MENNLLLAIFVLLAATVALVPLVKSLGFGTILGYLLAGVLIGPYGLALVADSETVRHIAEFGVVMMLFLIGLELQPAELWRMRDKLLGLGLTQLLGTAALIAAVCIALGMAWQVATIIGFALGMSSTAIVLQTVAARGITKTDTGRSSLSILLMQDVAVIPILALIPLLVTNRFAQEPDLTAVADWRTALEIVGVFAFAVLAGRYLIRPVIGFVARTGVHEAFTALGLALVVGAALMMQWFGLSPALGAFLGGMLLADSEYRHELESNIEPFKALLLGLFFISVGTSIEFSILAEQPFTVLGIVLGLVSLKALVIFILTTIFRMHMAERLLVSFLLCQAGEFAFVVLQFARSAAGIPVATFELLTVVVALSMAVTPVLIFAYDRFIAPRVGRVKARTPDEFGSPPQVIVLGYGRFGQIVTRMLRAQGCEMTLIDDDPAQIELMKRFGVKVFYGDGTRLEILRAAGAADAELIIIAVAGSERILSIAKTIMRHFPNAKVAARATDRNHAQDLMDAGIEVWERETFRGSLALGVKALISLGYSEQDAQRVAEAFEKHDTALLHETRHIRHDRDAYIGVVRRSTETLDTLLQADRLRIDGTEEEADELGPLDEEAGTEPASRDLDIPPTKASN